VTSAPDTVRCFVAVPLEDTLRESLAAAITVLREAQPDAADQLRWTEPDGWHLTLAFMGEVERAAIDEMAGQLDAVAAGSGSLVLATGAIGAFPSPRLARVLWYGVKDPDRRLRALAMSVRAALRPEDPGPFRPHVTLARSRHRHGSPVTDLVALARVPDGELVVDRLVLYQSRLSSGPARYEVLHTAPLAEAPSAEAPSPESTGAEATA
jgi:2'-5' RNA ligase